MFLKNGVTKVKKGLFEDPWDEEGTSLMQEILERKSETKHFINSVPSL
jgi:hypothetical protein